MAASLDKETLAKHGFWFLAGAYVLLVLGCLAVLATSVSDSVRKEQDELKKAEDLVKGVKGDANQAVVDAYKKQDDLVDSKRNEVWGKAWKTQEDMMTWPRDLQARFAKYKYFGDPIPDLADRSEFDEKYRTQLREVWEVVQPVTSKDEGVVQCKGGAWGDILQLDREFVKKPPTKDDIWLTQEELWVKRELLRVIREANDSVARFKEVVPETAAEKDKPEVKASPAADDAKTPKPEAAAGDKDQKAAKPAAPPVAKSDANHKIFRNPYWEFDVTLAGPEGGKYFLRGKVTNISKRKQPLDAKFKIFLQDTRAADNPAFQMVSIANLPLAVGESLPFNQPVQEQLTIEGLFGVEQVLNWRTAAVKRLDDLKLMEQAQSSRTIVRMLKPPRFLAQTSSEGGDSAAGADSAAASPAATPGVPGPGGLGAPVVATTTLNGLEINRYTDVNEQVRHMPVAMVVIIEEEHLPELLAAFVNSKLRIQITQYHWNHCRDRMTPVVDQEGGSQPSPGGVVSSGPMGRPPFGAGPGRGQTMVGGRPMGYGVRPGYPGPGGERSSATRPGAPGVPYGPSAGRMPGGPGPMRQPGPPGPSAGRMPSPGPGVGTTPDEDEEQEDFNLLEVAVYGLASLYERYPPKPEQPAPAGEKSAEKSAENSAAPTTGSK